MPYSNQTVSMNKTEKKIAQAAERFAKRWEGKGYEERKEHRKRIAQTAQAILDARTLYPDSSLAGIYAPITMPPELLKTHRDNNRAIMAAYNLPTSMTESEVVSHLFTLYNSLVKQQIQQLTLKDHNDGKK